MKNETYDRLKWWALTLPLFITFIAAIMKIWNIPYAVEIGLSLNAFNALIAGIVKIANEHYINDQDLLLQDELEENEEDFEEDLEIPEGDEGEWL